MLKVHMMLQAKGGVGKSTCSALLAQYLKDHRDRPALCIDTDATNPTFTGWRSLGVKHIKLAANGDLEKSRFDLVLEEIVDSDRDVIIDNGAQGFMPITSYMASNDTEIGIGEMERELILHSVVVGGEAYRDSMDGLLFLAEGFSSSPVVVWLNPKDGVIDRDAFDKALSEAGLSERVTVIDLPNYGGPEASTFGRDFNLLVTEKLTFKEGRAAKGYSYGTTRRFAMMEKRFFELFDGELAARELV